MGKELRDRVRERYADAARGVKGESDGCCGSSCCGSGSGVWKVDLTAGSYSAEELTGLPEEAVGASLGCGNPTALAALSPGEVVLDLGSGGGIDVLLSARRVSPGGKAYGVDMTASLRDGEGADDPRRGLAPDRGRKNPRDRARKLADA